MQDGTIQDCQITASSFMPANPPANARFNTTGNGWSSLNRGPPFYQKEYIQVGVTKDQLDSIIKN